MSRPSINPHIPDHVAHLNPDAAHQPDVDPGLVHMGGEGIWQNWKDTKTNKESIQNHRVKVVKTWGAEEDHYFEIKNPQKRIATCKTCKMERPFVLGRDKLHEGKFLKNV